MHLEHERCHGFGMDVVPIAYAWNMASSLVMEALVNAFEHGRCQSHEFGKVDVNMFWEQESNGLMLKLEVQSQPGMAARGPIRI